MSKDSGFKLGIVHQNTHAHHPYNYSQCAITNSDCYTDYNTHCIFSNDYK